MNINATLIGQMITFLILVVVTMKYIWPPVIKALEDRRRQIAEGLEAAERGRHELDLARHKIVDQLKEAKHQAAQIVDQANQRGNRIVEEAKDKAREESKRLILLAHDQIDHEFRQAKEQLLKQIATLSISGVEKILEKKIDESMNSHLVDQLIAEI